MPMKKRSLKDVASAPLVAKADSGMAREPGSRDRATAVTGQPKPQGTKRVRSSSAPPALPNATRAGAGSGRSPHRSLWRIAASIVVAFIGGIFFGRFIKI